MPRSQRPQRGLALVFVLLMMVVTAGAALMAAKLSTGGERATAYDRDRQIAFASAELALYAAERDLFESGGVRGCLFGTSAMVAGTGCSSGIPDPNGDATKDYLTRGLCGADPSLGDTPLYKAIDWEDASNARKYVRYGEWGDAQAKQPLQTGVAAAPADVPKYIVVQTAYPVDITSPTSTLSINARVQSRNVFRVYALGYGSSKKTQVMLEAVFIKADQFITCGSS